ncbi:MAG: excinuclease ABC subunit UvrC [Betaproteobacteria bacterium]|nr:MAG: excinuclease ABC subunit UvrC [Betaproteobacteria bacterium]
MTSRSKALRSEELRSAPRAAAFDARAFLATLPGMPGVYRMIGRNGEALYVGKAGDLKKRVSSYFQKTQHGPRIAVMLTQVADVEITVTRSEAEALILENNLIKSLSPRYNILFRDDKSYPYLMVSGGEFPRLGFHRGAMDKAHRYFGPFPHAGAVRESIQLLQRVFRLRTCEDSVFQNRSRPCLLHQIRRCTAPCVGLIGAEAYAEDVKSAQLYLEGRSDTALKRIEARMQEASEARRYEEAAVYRDQIQSLAKVSQRLYADTGADVDVDIIAVAMEQGLTCVNLMMVRGGRQLGDRSFFPQNAQERDAKEVLAAFIEQHYLERPVPAVVVVGEELDSGELEATLAEHAKRSVRILTRPTTERRAWLEMAQQNALQALKARLSEEGTQGTRLAALREGLGLPDTVQRIECFDVSHTMGEAAVAACVVYDRMDMRRGEYRRYNIDGVTPGDDYGALAQALARRYGRIAGGEGIAPDLIFIDGGKGQVSAAKEALAETGLSDIALVGIAKGPERKPGFEELWVGQRAVRLPPDHAGLHLIQRIRDEAHRFAVAGHRARRSRRRTTSTLEGISGIGAKRRRQLLTRFGGLKGVISASVEDLTQVEGISRKLAEKIYRELHAA